MNYNNFTSIDHWKKWLWATIRFVLILGLSFIILYPVLQKISTAFKHKSDLYSPNVIWIPEKFSIDNFKEVTRVMDYGATLWNTVSLSSITTILTVISCALAGYGFARLKFRGSNILFGGVILTILVPPTTILIPIYMNLKDFTLMGIIPLITGKSVNLLDSYWPFILTSITGNSLKAGLYIFIFRQFFRGIPKEIEEAAYIDGAGIGKTFTRIMIPNALPAVITTTLFSFVWQWNDSFYTTTYLTSSKVMSTQLSSLPYNLAIRLEDDTSGVDPFYLSMVQDTGILLSILPLIIIYLFVQRYFVESIERTGIVG
ncbi:carbohydrate ABC transporter permease [Lederbergia galactosidilytica]|uniref:ABC transporter permease n=1 Tax=Lederbergia galactosidilytica TaxID=217031 RepID=A0A0Q9Y3L4_9BACI|nr:carbohydrate ABC transporter permease [Lederbergia galactosidilytica]KRG09336.1 ABC transporter permease [Virgibacillus soli]KRG11746.1 ABC transporter permease [Lederbergia galactosidilytica]MBP1913440.1 multiple sugar transport system permease protein [Lederbergia galactosidilytica]OAK71388.1 ABC transporter permease [Lederbergia galactosidilytica]